MASSKRLTGILQCPVCLEIFNDPKMFKCMHFYCGACINELPPATKESTTGYKCPLCRQFTAKDQLRKMPLMQELLEAINQDHNELPNCGKCQNQKSSWRCIECKKNYCAPCSTNHDEHDFLKGHTWKALDESSPLKIDKHVLCPTHTDEMVKIYCRDCCQLISMVCNATTHKTHTAETIDEAVAKMLQKVKQDQTDVKTRMGETENVIAMQEEKLQFTQAKYGAIEDEIDKRYEEVMDKVKKDYNAVKRTLAESKTKAVTDIQQRVEALQLKMKSRRSVLQWSEATLASTEGSSLLHAMDSGLSASLSAAAKEDTQDKAKHEPDFISVPRFQSSARTTQLQENVIGEVHTDRRVIPAGKLKQSMWIPRSLDGLKNVTATKVNEIKTDYKCRRFAQINDELWCPETGTSSIHICSMNGKERKKLVLKGIQKCRSVAQVLSRVAVAATNGLFLIVSEEEGTTIKLQDGDFRDVSVQGDTMYALENSNEGKVHIVQVSATDYGVTRKEEKQLQRYEQHWLNTIQVTREHLYVAHCGEDIIEQYTRGGHLTATHEISRDGVEERFYPVLCGADADGALLVASYETHGLYTLTAAGVRHRVPVDGLGGRPTCAVLTADRLLVRLGFPSGISFQEFALK